jgi:hypothetical protein
VTNQDGSTSIPAEILNKTKDGQLVQLNMADMKDKISDQIRAFLLNMMPKEAFDQVIDSAWRNLTEPRPEVKDSYNRVTQMASPSELEEMVTTQMRQQLRKRVSEWSAEWSQTPACELGAKSMFTELVDMAAGKFIHRVSCQIVQEAAGVLAGAAQIQSTQCGSCHRQSIQGQQCSCGFWN